MNSSRCSSWWRKAIHGEVSVASLGKEDSMEEGVVLPPRRDVTIS